MTHLLTTWRNSSQGLNAFTRDFGDLQPDGSYKVSTLFSPSAATDPFPVPRSLLNGACEVSNCPGRPLTLCHYRLSYWNACVAACAVLVGCADAMWRRLIYVGFAIGVWLGSEVNERFGRRIGLISISVVYVQRYLLVKLVC